MKSPPGPIVNKLCLYHLFFVLYSIQLTSALITASPNCQELYLTRNVVYVFENTIDSQGALSRMTAEFLDILIRRSQSNILNPGSTSPYSKFAMVPFPDPQNMCIGNICQFMQDVNKVSGYSTLFLSNAQVYQIAGKPDGVNEGLLFSQTLMDTISANETIVLFANSDSGVAGASSTAKSLMRMGLQIITVAVGGYYNLLPLSSPGFNVHVLEAKTDEYALADEIIYDLISLGSTCAAATPATTMDPCPGGTYVYDGDIAVIFEATYLADPTAQTEQNVMMNTFISTQLLMYGKDGRTSGQKGSYDLLYQITRVLPIPYPNPGSYSLGTSGSFRNGPRSVDAFNATLVVVDTILGPPENEARIADGIQYTIQATDRGNYSAAIIVATSDAFVTQAQALAKQLQGMDYQVFTIALNSEKDFSSLATDTNSTFTLPNPKNALDGIRISQAIGDFLISKSSQCVRITTPPESTRQTTTDSTTISTTTNACLQEYLNRNIVYLFENTNDITLSNMSANFIPILANKANRDLLGSGTIDPYSQMMAMPYPNPDNVCGGLCQFGPVNPDNVAYYTAAFMIYGQTQPADPDGLNQGVIYAQGLMENLNKNGNTQTIVFFANSAQGVADAQKNVNDFKKKGVALAAVSVGGNYALLASLTSPNFKVHVLEDGIDQNALADEIVTELMTLGTTCVKTTTPTTPTPGTGNTDGTAPTTTSARTTATAPICKENYINRDVIYMFESTVSRPGVSTSSAASILSATFLNTLIPQVQSDLMGSGKASPYSFFSLFSYPDEDQACSIINCNFGQIPLDGVPSNTGSLLIISQTFETLPSDDGIDGSLTYSQSLPLAGDSQKNGEIIVLFANSESGVAKAMANAKQLNDNNVAIITVSVGGNYDFSPLSYPGFAVHYLDSTTNSTQLAQEIIAEMVTLGTACVT